MSNVGATFPRSLTEMQARKAALLAQAYALRWSQNTLARRAKFNPGYISRLLNRAVDPAWFARLTWDAQDTFLKLERAVAREQQRRAKRGHRAA